jgi:chemotaxis protein MotB
MADNQVIIVKKKAAHGHGHHGGSWKVAYADFVTAMMAFFMVMWIMGLSEENKNIIQGYFNDPLGFNKTVPRSNAIVDLKMKPNSTGRSGRSDGKGSHDIKSVGDNAGELAKIEKAAKQLLESDPELAKALKEHIDFRLTEEGLRLEFKEAATPVFFESGSAVLRKEGLKLIQKIGPFLAQKGCKIIVEGHTDSVGYGSKASYSNWELSQDRAGAMRRALIGSGVNYGQFQGVMGYAETKPLYPDTRDPRNRRVSVLVPKETTKEILGGGENEPKKELMPEVKIKPNIDPFPKP